MKLTIMSFLFALLPLLVSADTVEINGIYYNLISKGNVAEVVKNPQNGYKGNIVIPDVLEYEGTIYNVTKIGDWAFSYCTELTSVSIPKSVISIGDNAFQDNYNLTSVHIKDLASWCMISFGKENKNDYYSNPLIRAHHLFLNGEEIKDLVIPDNVTSINNGAFCGGSFISVTFPNSVTSIGKEAFKNCTTLTSVHIIDLEAWCTIKFGDNDSNPLAYAHHLYLNGEEIKNLIIPNSISEIKDYTFSGCSALTSVAISNNATSIGDYSFSDCSNINTVNIPNGVTSIGYDAFRNCTELKSLSLPNSLISLSGFNGCTGLTTLSIPNSVKNISGFNNCTKLTSIPNSVNYVFNAFYGCTALTSIKLLGDDFCVTDKAFGNCPNLSDIYSYGENTIPDPDAYGIYGREPGIYISRYAFDGSYIEYATLHVPESSINIYKNTAPWSEFGKFVALSNEGTETQKCATPSISIENDKIKFQCDTEGAEFIRPVRLKK